MGSFPLSPCACISPRNIYHCILPFSPVVSIPYHSTNFSYRNRNHPYSLHNPTLIPNASNGGTICRGESSILLSFRVPNTGLQYVYIQVKIVGSPHVDTVRIPCDGSRPTVDNFVLTVAGTTEVPIDTCNKGEKKLLAFPQVWACEKSPRTFSWKHRSLTSLFAEDIARHNGGWGGDYWMYSCRDKEAGMYRE